MGAISGVPTFLDNGVWLPVGTDLVGVHADGSPVPRGAFLVHLDPATGRFIDRVRLSEAGSLTFAMGDSIVVRTQSGADVVSMKTLRRVRKLPGGSVLAFGSIWDFRNGVLIRINPKTGKITGRRVLQGPVDFNGVPQLVTAGAGSIWASLTESPTVVRIDPKTLRRVASIGLDHVDDYATIGFSYGYVWADLPYNVIGKLYRIDPATNSVTGTSKLGDPNSGDFSGRGSLSLGFGNDSVFTCDISRTITQVNSATIKVENVRKPPFDCSYIGVGAGSVWISSYPVNDEPLSARLDLH